MVQEQLQRRGGGQCVEAAASQRIVHVRDSKLAPSLALTMDRTAWAAFIGFDACDDSEGWPPHASADRLSLEVRFLTPWIPKWVVMPLHC